MVENHYFRACVSQRRFGGTQGKCTLFLSIASHSHQQMSFESFLPQSLFLSPFINSHHGFLLQHALRLLVLLGFQAASLLQVENIHLLDGEAETESFFKF